MSQIRSPRTSGKRLLLFFLIVAPGSAAAVYAFWWSTALHGFELFSSRPHKIDLRVAMGSESWDAPRETQEGLIREAGDSLFSQVVDNLELMGLEKLPGRPYSVKLIVSNRSDMPPTTVTLSESQGYDEGGAYYNLYFKCECQIPRGSRELHIQMVDRYTDFASHLQSLMEATKAAFVEEHPEFK